MPVKGTASGSNGTTAPTGTAPNSPQHRTAAANQRACSAQNVTTYITIGTECLPYMYVTQQTQSWEGECSAVVESSLGHQAAIRAAASSSCQRTAQNIERLNSPLRTVPRNCDRTPEAYSRKRASSTCEHVNEKMPL